MSDKAKRKANPRRRTLIRLIIGIAIIVALVSAGIVALRPTGAQIVFIAPDDNGVNNIWIADLNNPEHPRQVTFYERPEFWINRDSNFVNRPQAYNGVLVENGVIVYLNRSAWLPAPEIWIFDTRTNRHELVKACTETYCDNLMLHPEGEWIAYEDYLRINDEPGLGGTYQVSITVENLLTHERKVIFEDIEMRGEYSSYHLVSWMPGTTSIAFLQFDDDSSSLPILNLYDVTENQIIDSREWSFSPSETVFSDDGLHFVQHHDRHVDRDLILFVFDFYNQENILYDFIEPGNLGELSMTYFHDWYPDNETMLISNVWLQADTDSRIHQLLLYNIATGSSDILSVREDIMYTAASFNDDATEILVGLRDARNYEMQIMLYDMEAGEEIALPLFGHSPQWVNGGR